MTWWWLSGAALIAIHEEQLVHLGGSAGLRDEGLLEFTLDRPERLTVYGEPDAADLAAAYGFGLARSHCFADASARTAAIAVETFLHLNGVTLGADDAALAAAFGLLADGELEEAELASWLRENTQAA